MKVRSRIASVLLTLSLVLLLICGRQDRAAGGDEPKDSIKIRAVSEPSATPLGRHALLVGCTLYPNLPLHDLEGPGNDVLLMRQLLMDKFGFEDKNIVILSEASGEVRGKTYRPTRKNIEREFKRLSQKAKPTDQVVVLLCGHGSQQPEPDPPPDLRYAEADGLDEVFLPADAGSWDEQKKGLANAIVDDEFRVWTEAIVNKGAFLFFVADCCHSGTLLRGSEVVRQIKPEDLKIPAAEIQAAQKRAAKRNQNNQDKKSPFDLQNVAGKLAAIYACRSHEPTVELTLPRDSPEAKRHGLLTYNLCQVLVGSQSSLTYRELVQRIQGNYERQGRDFPVPLVEGNGRDFKVLGQEEWPGRSRYLLSKDQDKHWRVNGGILHGFTKNSVLAIYPPSGQAGADTPAGHVRIKAAGPFRATVEPCAFGKLARSDQLPQGGRCEPVYIDFGTMQLMVAVDRTDERGKPLPPEAAKGPESILRQLAGEKGSLIQLAADPARADWLVRPGKEGLFLLPARGVARKIGNQDLQLGPLPADPLDPKAGPKLREPLLRIARVQNLRRLAGAPAGEVTRSQRLKVKVEVVKFSSKDDRQGKVLPFAPEMSFRDGDIVAFRVTNVSAGKKMYVSLLYMGADFEIAPLYPEPEDVQEPLVPDRPIQTRALRVRRPWGLESLLVIAVPAKGQPIDFTGLAQPSLEGAKRGERGQSALDTPLGRLLQNACFGEGTRGLGSVDIDDHLLELRSWTALPRE